jgi:hypothetical protein
MCKRWAVVLVGMLALPPQASAAAQVRDAASQRALLDSLIPQLYAAKRALLHADSVERAMQISAVSDPLDTAVVHPFVLIAPRGQAAETFAAFRAAVRRSPALYADFPVHRRLTLGVEWQAKPHRRLQLLARENNLRMVALYGGSSSRRAKSADAAARDALLPLMPHSVRVWLQDQHWSRGTETDRVYRSLAMSPSPVGQRCFRSDVTACARALGLAPLPDSLHGYTADQLRKLAAQRISRFENPGYWRSCVEAGLLDRCLAYLEQTGGVPPALYPFARASFLMFALERGGSGAFARLTDPQHRDAATAIAAAANNRLPTLLAHWREYIDESREQSYAGLPAAVAAAFLWTVVAALIAMHSTRRRAE